MTPSMGPSPAPVPERDPLDLAVVLTLARSALDAGASVPAALRAVGACAGEEDLTAAGAELLLGAPWEEAVADVPARLAPLVDALAPSWESGADPDRLLELAARTVREGRSRQARVAAERLAVRLVVPLGLCHLPAFLLLGLVPVVLSFVGGLVG